MPQLKPVTNYSAIVGRVLVWLRELDGKNQAAVATDVGVTQATWSRIERGESGLTVEQLASAAEVLNTTPGSILGKADDAMTDLRSKGVIVENTRPPSGTQVAIAMIAAAALGVLIAKAITR